MPNALVIKDIDRLIRLTEVKALTGLSTSSIYRLLATESFPAQIPLGARSVAWVESEVLDWMRSRIALRPTADGKQAGVTHEG
jgi:prophage regulatory protein